jgi:hypothetical protein
MSSEDSELNRSRVSIQLQEIVKVAISKLKNMEKIHYTFIKVTMYKLLFVVLKQNLYSSDIQLYDRLQVVWNQRIMLL